MPNECQFCTDIQTKALDEFNKAMRGGAANMTAKFRPTGAKHGGNQKGIEVMYGTQDPALMLLMSTVAGLHTQRSVLEYWRKQGCDAEAAQHTLKALLEMAKQLESEYVKRLQSIEALEKGD